MSEKRTNEWIVTLLANHDFGYRPHQQHLAAQQPLWYLRLECFDVLRDIDLSKQIPVVAVPCIDKAVVDVQDRSSVYWIASALHHPRLDRCVLKMVIADLSR